MAKKRDRGERRRRERALRKLVRKRDQLVELEAGGTPKRPLRVASAAVVESRATAHPCHQCQGQVGLVEHDVVTGGPEPIRRVLVQCRACHAKRTWFIAITPAGPN